MTAQEIIKLYQDGDSLASLSRESGLSAQKIKGILTNAGIQIRTRAQQNVITNKRRKKAVDDNYFKTIGVNQAWLMGFIAADGTIRKDNNSIKISLSSVDKKMLEDIRSELKIERKVADYETNNGFAVSQLEWSSKEHKDFLASYGIVNRKTYLPMLVPSFDSKELILAFILGYYDGDGSFSVDKTNKYCRFRIVAHRREILDSIAENLNNFYQIKYSISLDKSGVYELSISTTYAVTILKDMYALGSLRLERKYKKFLEYIGQETTTSL